jgi:hypothetical protein
MKKIYIIGFSIWLLSITACAYLGTTQAQTEYIPAPIEQQPDTRAQDIDDYFHKRGMPLEGYGKKFVEAADRNNIDWRLLPAISVKESTGGKFLIPGSYNAFGWGSGSVKFKSYDEAIDYITNKFGTGKYYAGKSVEGILKTYNPPSVEPEYSKNVIWIMEQFEK